MSTISTTISTKAPEAGRDTGRRRLLAVLWIAALLLAGPALASAVETAAARAVMDDTVSAVLAVLQAPDLESVERRTRLEAIARERFDFETMSKLVLRRSWRKFTPDQRIEFVEAFADHLAASYGTRIDRYDQEGVEITGERVEPRGDVTVLTRIVGGQADDVAIDYRLRLREDLWRVIDVKIEGVSLVSSFRSQFKEVLSQGGPEEVLRRLKEKTVAAGDSEAS